MGAIMDADQLAALAGLAVAMTWTPGPNNVMLAASGANFGWRRTVPHAMGVSFGFPLMLFVIAMGLGQVFMAEPRIAQALGWIGLAVILWFAWRIAMAAPARTERRSRPLSFLEAGAFQWVNPKAWTFAVLVTATYITGPSAVEAALVAALVFLLSGLGSSQAWAVFGTAVGRLLGQGRRLRAFNLAMAALLAASAVWLVAAG
jgi:threonine/homoserine/homoserine lactone efflux protein